MIDGNRQKIASWRDIFGGFCTRQQAENCKLGWRPKYGVVIFRSCGKRYDKAINPEKANGINKVVFHIYPNVMCGMLKIKELGMTGKNLHMQASCVATAGENQGRSLQIGGKCLKTRGIFLPHETTRGRKWYVWNWRQNLKNALPHVPRVSIDTWRVAVFRCGTSRGSWKPELAIFHNPFRRPEKRN